MQEAVEKSFRLKLICSQILENPNEWSGQIKELQTLLPLIPAQIIQKNLPALLSIAYLLFKNVSEGKSCFKTKDKEALVDAYKILFDKVAIDKIGIFFNFTGFLLSELYDPVNHKVTTISEEYKLLIVQCMISLTKSVSWEIVTEIYKKENTPKLCQALYVALEIAKTEKLRSLRLSAIELLMCLAQVHNDEMLNDLELRCSIANVFMFFLPGLASGLRNIALEDEKSGHKVIAMALRAWGRIVCLFMEDFNAFDQKINTLSSDFNNKVYLEPKVKWKSPEEVKAYIENSNRTPDWYLKTDENLYKIIQAFSKLIEHSHVKIRLELVKMCCLLLDKCNNTMPKCISHTVHILIGCSEDVDSEVRNLAQTALNELSNNFSSDLHVALVEKLEEKFYNVISTLPRIFNRKDKTEQLLHLKLLSGYVNLFGTYKLSSLLLSPAHLHNLLKTLMHICEFDTNNIHLLEEIANPDLEIQSTTKQWKEFHYFFNDNDIACKIQEICGLFRKYDVTDIVSDYLLDVFINESDKKSEATFLLNSIFNDNTLVNNKEKHLINNILITYLQPEYWNLIITNNDDLSLPEIRKNILQVCLQTEGIGIFADCLKKDFDCFLLKSLYLILERAGSNHPLIRQVGLSTVKSVIKACGYNNITEFINVNSDYFTYHVTKNLNKFNYSRDVLNVLTVVMEYSTVEVLPSLSNIIEEVLAQSCDKFQSKFMYAYLRVFNIFIKCLHRWFNIEIIEVPIKSKLQKQKEFEEFKISGIENINKFSDDIMGKTAEEMYKEDLEKNKEELQENQVDDEYKKPVAPSHVNMTVSILKRTLHFLPSKDRKSKLLALEVLRNGLEVVRDWEDDLLPIVHQIWSPLVNRFLEHKEPLIVNLSFQLLVTMARLSKDFIRTRTTKDVLPEILKILKDLSQDSYLKDRGSSYRYTQAYKLQLTILQQLASLIINLDIIDSQIELISEAACLYLSDKQPLPLQEAAESFFRITALYDVDLIERWLQNHLQSNSKIKPKVILLLQYCAGLKNETSVNN